jgi:hypothetical protein
VVVCPGGGGGQLVGPPGGQDPGTVTGGSGGSVVVTVLPGGQLVTPPGCDGQFGVMVTVVEPGGGGVGHAEVGGHVPGVLVLISQSINQCQENIRDSDGPSWRARRARYRSNRRRLTSSQDRSRSDRNSRRRWAINIAPNRSSSSRSGIWRSMLQRIGGDENAGHVSPSNILSSITYLKPELASSVDPQYILT